MDSAMILGHLTPILSTLSEGILLADANGHITYINPSFTQLTGFTDGDLLGKTCRAMHGPLTDKETVRTIRAAIHAARPFSGDILNYTKSGETFWNDLSITPVFDHGDLTGFLGITRDSSARKQAAAAQDARERLFSFLFRHVQAGIVLHRADTKVIYTNEAALRLLGMTHKALVGAMSTDQHFQFLREDGSVMPLEEFPVARALGTRSVIQSLVLGIRQPLGGQVWVMCHAVPNLDVHGEPTEVVVSFTDITGLKETEQALSKSEQRLSLVLRGANDAAWDWDLVTDELYYSPRWWEMLGYLPDEQPADSQFWKQLVHPDDIDTTVEALGQVRNAPDTSSYELEFRLRHRDGHYVPVLSRAFVQRDASGKAVRIAGTNTDLTERKRSEQQVHRLAYYDMLTGLPNRRLLMERLDAMVSRPPSLRDHGAMLFADIDNFKLLNDTLGHDVGDQLLRQVTRRLLACVSDQDMLARLGGDEFVALLEHLGDDPAVALRAAEAEARKIRDVLSLPYTLGSTEYRCTVSIGIALFDHGERGADATLKHADLAMYQAKAAGKDTLRVYDESMQVAVQERVALENDLRSDLAAHRLQLHFQPQVNSAGQIVGAEALLRWPHATRGLISPNDFIPIAEACGLIMPLGEWVLEAACRQLNAWADDPLSAGLCLSINASVRQFHDPGFVSGVLDILQHTGVNPARLKIEVTESLFAENMECVIANMARLRETGLRFSLDDFGTGYSSLSYLQRMPLDEIKIDRSFILDVPGSEHAATIARMIISLAENLKITVLAEGVETEAQRAFLHEHGCDHYQGYLFSPAVPLEEFEAILRAGGY